MHHSLVQVMQKHQKYFAITDDSGKLLPYFITVANGPINEMVVREGNEAVLRARYEDAKFFYEMDTRRRLSEFQSQLKGILFHRTAAGDTVAASMSSNGDSSSSSTSSSLSSSPSAIFEPDEI
ncbi:Glycine--tRNA ligase, chloroplastic/mitochondrial 2 [Linum perenne]